MNYKLINKLTGEEYICKKMTVGEFDYYVSDEKPIPCNPANVCMAHITKLCDKCGKYQGRKVIATNNPNIDIPKVVCDIDLTKLCYYDRRNPDFSIKEEYGYDKEEVEATGNFAKKDCACDNCFYGRSQLTEQLIKSQETHPFSEEDMIEFAEFSIKNNFCKEENRYYQYWELLQLWREQKLKTLYYV